MSELSAEQVEAVTQAVCGRPGPATSEKKLETEVFATRWRVFTGPELAILCTALQRAGAKELRGLFRSAACGRHSS